MNQEIKSLIIILILFLIIDIPMITKFNYEMYNKQFLRINNDKTVKDIYIGAIVAYACLVFGIYYFVIKNNMDNKITTIAKNGALFGFIVYAIYNGTNKATIAEFGTNESIIDTLWGSILCALISVLTVYFIKKYN